MHSNIKHTPQNTDATRYHETTCKTKQVSCRAHSKRSNGSTHTQETSLKGKLSKTTTRQLASIKTICYSHSPPHIGELKSLTTRHCMTKQSYLQQDDMFMKLTMARASS